MINSDLYRPFLDLDIRNNGPVNIDKNYTFLQINKVVDCLRERGEIRNYNKDDKCLALLHINDGTKDLMLLILDSDSSIMNLDPGSKLLINLSNLKCTRGIYLCLKSQVKLLGGIVQDLKQANDMAKEAYLLRKMSLYKKTEDGPPKFKPLADTYLKSHKTNLGTNNAIKSQNDIRVGIGDKSHKTQYKNDSIKGNSNNTVKGDVRVGSGDKSHKTPKNNTAKTSVTRGSKR